MDKDKIGHWDINTTTPSIDFPEEDTITVRIERFEYYDFIVTIRVYFGRKVDAYDIAKRLSELDRPFRSIKKYFGSLFEITFDSKKDDVDDAINEIVEALKDFNPYRNTIVIRRIRWNSL